MEVSGVCPGCPHPPAPSPATRERGSELRRSPPPVPKAREAHLVRRHSCRRYCFHPPAPSPATRERGSELRRSPPTVPKAREAHLVRRHSCRRLSRRALLVRRHSCRRVVSPHSPSDGRNAVAPEIGVLNFETLKCYPPKMMPKEISRFARNDNDCRSSEARNLSRFRGIVRKKNLSDPPCAQRRGSSTSLPATVGTV